MRRLLKNYQFNWITISVGLLLVFRLYLNATLPLMDKTEARYAEIARIMVETNNWVVPHIDYDVPFWAKPPLSTWLTAFSFKWFGVNEFTARLPYFLLSVFMALMLGKYAKREGLPFCFAALILFTIPQFFLHAGVVSTDTALAFSIVLIMLSFWETVSVNKNWVWKYLFFFGISFGLLSKGPIVLVLTIPPILIWTWLNKSFNHVLKSFPWITGGFIIALVGLSWYYYAEQQSPGFIDYFIFGEHFRRFFDSNWTGDKYGFPKSQPLGMIWVFLLLFALPWIQIVIAKIITSKNLVFKNKWVSFLVLWLLWTPFFFTISKSLIHPYIMPVMAPIALLMIYWWKGFKYKATVIKFILAIPTFVLGVYGYAQIANKVEFYSNSDKYFINEMKNFSVPLFHYTNKSYSGQFYSKGKLRAIHLEKLQENINEKIPFSVIVKNKDTSKISAYTLERLKTVSVNYKKTLYLFSPEENNLNND